jgi:hypothetical protein
MFAKQQVAVSLDGMEQVSDERAGVVPSLAKATESGIRKHNPA